jgi:hypothetical protein
MATAQIEIPKDPHARVKLFRVEYPGGYKGSWRGAYEAASRYLPPRCAAITAAMRELEQNFGPIVWGSGEFDLRVTYGRRKKYIRCGADTNIVGQTLDGVGVQYRYKQGLYAEGGNREFKHNGCKWTSISQIRSYVGKLIQETA